MSVADRCVPILAMTATQHITVGNEKSIPTLAVMGLCLLAGCGALSLLVSSLALPAMGVTLLTDLPVSAAIFIAAGGWGWLCLRKIIPRETPTALTAVFNAIIDALKDFRRRRQGQGVSLK